MQPIRFPLLVPTVRMELMVPSGRRELRATPVLPGPRVIAVFREILARMVVQAPCVGHLVSLVPRGLRVFLDPKVLLAFKGLVVPRERMAPMASPVPPVLKDPRVIKVRRVRVGLLATSVLEVPRVMSAILVLLATLVWLVLLVPRVLLVKLGLLVPLVSVVLLAPRVMLVLLVRLAAWVSRDPRATRVILVLLAALDPWGPKEQRAILAHRVTRALSALLGLKASVA